MTALEKIKEITAFLGSCGIDDANIESEIILRHCLSINKASLYRDNPALSEENLEDVKKILERRAKKEPLQYIIGHVEFYGLKIKVGEGVLIPRPETELLLEEVVKATESREQRAESAGWKMLDLCTGSGCLALALAKNFPDAKVYATDISATAIRYAKENAELNGISNAVFKKNIEKHR